MRQRNPELNRERQDAILDAATTCFIRQGFHASSMKDICAAAAMSPGTLYHYFPSKAAIVAEIVEREREANAALLAALNDAPDIRQGLRLVVEAIARDTTDRDLQLRAEVFCEILRDAGLRAQAMRNEALVTEALAARLAFARDAGQLPMALQPRATAIAIIAIIEGLLVRATLLGMEALAAELPVWHAAVAELLFVEAGR